MRYRPFASVVTDRTFSISAGLLASTVTPGSTAPVVSFTTPANELCARAVAGSSRHPNATANKNPIRLLNMPLLLSRQVRQRFSSERIWRILVGIHLEIAIVDMLSASGFQNLDRQGLGILSGCPV